jgi:hypothetical protein
MVNLAKSVAPSGNGSDRRGGGGRRGAGKGNKVSKRRRERVERLLGLMGEAEERGCEEVWAMKARLRMVSCKSSADFLSKFRFRWVLGRGSTGDQPTRGGLCVWRSTERTIPRMPRIG